MKSTLHIKNMVCERCVRVVKEELEALNLQVLDLKLGEVIVETPENQDFKLVAEALEKAGFELLADKNKQIVDQIKTLIIEVIHHKRSKMDVNFSELIFRELGKDYSSLSGIFSSTEQITIEKFIILQRIERVKELINYDQLSLTEIAFEAGFSSMAHLSSQFKKVTGMSPGIYKKEKGNRKPLDKIEDK